MEIYTATWCPVFLQMRPTCLLIFPVTYHPRALLLTDRTATSRQRAAAAISIWLHQLAASTCSLKTWTVQHLSSLLRLKMESFCSPTFLLQILYLHPIQVFVRWIQEVKQTWRHPSIPCSATIKVLLAHFFAGKTCTPLILQKFSQVLTNYSSNGGFFSDDSLTTGVLFIQNMSKYT